MTVRDRMTLTMQAVKDHPSTPWVLWPVGLGGLTYGFWFIAKHPPTDRLDMGFKGGIVVVSLLIIPGVAAAIGNGISAIAGPARSAWRAFKDAKAGDSSGSPPAPPTGGAS